MQEVRIFDGKGALKKVISAEQLRKQEWAKMGVVQGWGGADMFPSNKSDEFKPKKRSRRKLAKKKREPKLFHRKCVTCGVAFETSRSNKMSCTDECREQGRRKEGVTKQCIQCGADFVTHNVTKGKYCGSPCSHVTHRAYMAKKESLLRKRGIIK